MNAFLLCSAIIAIAATLISSTAFFRAAKHGERTIRFATRSQVRRASARTIKKYAWVFKKLAE